MKEIILTSTQEAWLLSHGGRTIEHVQQEGDDLYILMNLAGGGSEKVLIP